MAEEFQTGICGGARWINPSRSSSLSPCSADSSSMVCQSAQNSEGNSTLQMMNLSSSTDWNQSFLRGNRRVHENNYPTMMLEDFNSQIQKEWSPKSFTSRFPVNSASYGYDSALLQGYFVPDPHLDVQQSVCNNRSIALASNYISTENYGTNVSNEQSPSWPKFAPKREPGGLHFSNNTPFWNFPVATSLNGNRPGPPATALGEKPNCPIFTDKYNNEEVSESGSAAEKGSSSEPTFKRPRFETPSHLPTFKVRKQKLGDRITSLQQLVSPFGKTDTSSVLQEAIEYIKFLHDQVSVLTTPYMKQGTPMPLQQGSDHKLKDPEEPKQDIKSRGLCLVPISSTIPVANETTDFWTPTFGGTF